MEPRVALSVVDELNDAHGQGFKHCLSDISHNHKSLEIRID